VVPAAALLEILVHFEIAIGDLPARYRLLKVNVPDDLQVDRVSPTDLGSDWIEDTQATRAITTGGLPPNVASAIAGGPLGGLGLQRRGAGFVGGSNDPVSFGRVAKIFVDARANEAYLADGYLNKRVAVVDADTGKLKRWWGAYGNKPDDTPLPAYDPAAPPAKQFRNPVHCADLSADRMLYVCDRAADRLQVFTPEGKFVKEAFFDKDTKASGSAWDIAFSKDPQQKYIFMADGMNDKVHIIDRQTLQELTTFGDGGRQPGQFFGVHSIATDSKGNIYTTETWEGKRLQRFVNKGLGPVTKPDQGVVWPTATR
jgi:DNA-binding beta-propeller fold protein YncE